MNVVVTTVASLVVSLGSASALSQHPPETTTAAEFIEIFEQLGGKHPGFRKAHAAGVCATGEFVPNPSLSAHSTSKIFKADTVPAIMRFSLGGPNPLSDEKAAGTRGIGIQLTLPDGTKHNITGNNTPFFTGKDPQTFIGFLRTLLPDDNGVVDPTRTGAYIAANPSVVNAVQWSRSNPAPTSFAREKYFGIHTFYMIDDAGIQTKFRWTLEPDLGEQDLDPKLAEQLPDRYLKDTLMGEVEQANVSFTLVATLGTDEDPDIDPSVAWPDQRPKITMGSLVLNTAGGDSCDRLNFDPNVLSSGFKASDDPVLQMRSPAYAISMGKRLSNQ